MLHRCYLQAVLLLDADFVPSTSLAAEYKTPEVRTGLIATSISQVTRSYSWCRCKQAPPKVPCPATAKCFCLALQGWEEMMQQLGRRQAIVLPALETASNGTEGKRLAMLATQSELLRWQGLGLRASGHMSACLISPLR